MPSMKYISRLLLSVMTCSVFSLLAGCSDESSDLTIKGEGAESGVITLKLSAGNSSTRATEADLANENLIETALVMLYPNDNPSGKPAIFEFKTLGKNTDGEVKISLNANVRDQLFPNGATTCGAYVIANITNLEAARYSIDNKLEYIREDLVVSSDFRSKNAPSSFAMDGDTNNVQLYQLEESEGAKGTVNLQRLASKINLEVKIKHKVENNGEEWELATNSVSALIFNGVNSCNFKPATYEPTTGQYFNTSNSTATDEYGQRVLDVTKDEDDFKTVSLKQPFYTMPNKWDESDLNREKMTYMTIRVPWRKVGTTQAEFQYCYYTIPIVRGNQITRNISYRVKVNVEMLGSFQESNPTPLELEDLSYYAVEWGSVESEVNISSNRYLVIDQTNYVLNNEAEIVIPFYSSHETTLVDWELTYYRYYYNDNGVEEPITITKEQWEKTKSLNYGEIYSKEIHNKDDADPNFYLTFKHVLEEWDAYDDSNTKCSLSKGTGTRGDIDKIEYYRKPEDAEKSYTRYVAKLTFTHVDKIDDPNFTKTITITQYPQMYIEATKNYTNSSGKGTAVQGNMYVNGYQNGTSSNSWLRTAGLGGSNSTNACPNQYVITVTQLDLGTNYVIGDPRELTYTDLYGWMTWTTRNGRNEVTHYFNEDGASTPDHAWVDAPGIEDLNTPRKLKYYYPTDSSTDKARWIAPKFRVASSYAVLGDISYDACKARCAGYQELDKPAGRWRMPTVAEIEYIMNLSQGGKIPKLYSTGTTYFSAQGAINTDDLTNYGYLRTPSDYSGSTAVRCVYDEWYWGDDNLKPNGTVQGDNRNETIDKYDFTWGDRQRVSVTSKPSKN